MIQDKVTFVDNLLVVMDGRHGISGVAGGGPSRVRPNELHCSKTVIPMISADDLFFIERAVFSLKIKRKQ